MLYYLLGKLTFMSCPKIMGLWLERIKTAGFNCKGTRIYFVYEKKIFSSNISELCKVGTPDASEMSS